MKRRDVIANGALLALFVGALVAYIVSLPPTVKLGGSAISYVTSRALMFAGFLLAANVGWWLLRDEAVGAKLIGGVILLGAIVWFVVVVALSFPQY